MRLAAAPSLRLDFARVPNRVKLEPGRPIDCRQETRRLKGKRWRRRGRISFLIWGKTPVELLVAPPLSPFSSPLLFLSFVLIYLCCLHLATTLEVLLPREKINYLGFEKWGYICNTYKYERIYMFLFYIYIHSYLYMMIRNIFIHKHMLILKSINFKLRISRVKF